LDTHACLYHIHELLPYLSLKEKIVAEHILGYPEASVHPSIEELAERIGVSESTLFRFVRRLGYSGYQQFRIALATETVDPHKTIFEQDIATMDEKSALVRVFKTSITALEQTISVIDPADLLRVAEKIIAAERIFFFGLGGSSIVAQDAYHKLVRSGLACCAPLDFHMQLMQASQLRTNDAVLLISHTGVNKDALAIAETVKQSGAGLIVISNYGRSPLVKLADISLLVHTKGNPYASEAFSARIVQLALIDCLYVMIMDRLGSDGHKQLERMRRTIAGRRT